jgi:hypothetical protein
VLYLLDVSTALTLLPLLTVVCLIFSSSITSRMVLLLKSWIYGLQDSLSSIWCFFQKNRLPVKERVFLGIHLSS